MDSDERKELVKFLKSQRLMTLATFEKKPWICTVLNCAAVAADCQSCPRKSGFLVTLL